MLRLNKEKHITIVYITHKMEEAILRTGSSPWTREQSPWKAPPTKVFTQVDRIRALGWNASGR